MRKQLLMIILLSMSLSAFASASKKTSKGFVPAINRTASHKKTITRYVPVPVPGQLMPIKNIHPMSSYYHHAKKRLTGVAAVKAANQKAQRQPNSSEYINAIMSYDYMPGALYQIYCAPLSVTDMQFEVGEKIISVAAGDTLRWQLSKTYSGAGLNRYEHLLVKPIDEELTNSLVVTTNLRTYHLELHSTSGAYMASVQWRYPGESNFVERFSDDSSAAKGVDRVRQRLNLSKLDFNYQAYIINGKTPSWMPEMVFNDGQKTYVQFPANMQTAPTLFVGDSLKHTVKMVNYRVEGNYYIVDRVVRKLELREGQTNPTIIQIKYGDK